MRIFKSSNGGGTRDIASTKWPKLYTELEYTLNRYSQLLWLLCKVIKIQDVRSLPEFHRVLLEFVVFLVIEEIGFFYSHWMLHHKRVRTRTKSGFFHTMIPNDLSSCTRYTSTSTRSITSGRPQWPLPPSTAIRWNTW